MNKRSPMVSIVVPVYNQEKYIRECLESVITQTYHNWELILVDNNSTDKSMKICKEYAASDGRIKLFEEKKQGVSHARNMGISRAEGDYIMFIDPDDTVENSFLSDMLDAAELKKIVACRINLRYKDKIIAREVNIEYLADKYDAVTCRSGIDGFVWNKLYDSKIIKNKGITFDAECRIYEDMLFNCAYMQYVEEIKIINKPLYNYRIRKNGGSHSRDDISALKKVEKFLILKERRTTEIERRIIRAYINNNNKDEEYHKRLRRYLFNMKVSPFEKLRIIKMMICKKQNKCKRHHPGELYE